jgi:hypothetical protein
MATRVLKIHGLNLSFIVSASPSRPLGDMAEISKTDFKWRFPCETAYDAWKVQLERLTSRKGLLEWLSLTPDTNTETQVGNLQVSTCTSYEGRQPHENVCVVAHLQSNRLDNKRMSCLCHALVACKHNIHPNCPIRMHHKRE